MNAHRTLALSAVAILLSSQVSRAQSNIGTAFTYQGELLAGGMPVDDTCDFRFGLWDADAAGNQVGTSPQTVSAVEVAAGTFTVAIDFGAGAINGTARWLEIEVQCPGDGDFVLLSPRVEMTPAPHALALPGLYTQQTASTPNIVGGATTNYVMPGSEGVTISGGGSDSSADGICVGGENDGSVCDACINQDGEVEFSPCDPFFCTLIGESCEIGNSACPGGACISAKQMTSGNFASIGGGMGITAAGSFSTVAGGEFNRVYNDHATISGGKRNSTAGTSATVGGGDSNTAGGLSSTVPGGSSNTAGGSYSFAAGRRAKVRGADVGTFAWADAIDADFTSTGGNQFLIRAGGGVGINTNDPDVELEINGGTELNLSDGSGFMMIGDQDGPNIAFDTDEMQARNNAAASDMLFNPAGGNVGIGVAPTDRLTVAGVVRSTTGGFALPDGTIIDAADDLGPGIISSLDASDGNPVDAVVVDAIGNVGIGTATPGSALDVAGEVRSTGAAGGQLTAYNPNNQGASVHLSWLADVARIRVGGSGAGNANGLDIQRGGDNSLMRILNNGNVGIGTTTPETRLQISGGSDASAAGGGYITLGSTTGTNVAIDNNEIMARDNGVVAALGINGDGGNIHMIGTGTGNVGIGTNEPSAKLDVVGSLEVDGMTLYVNDVTNRVGIGTTSPTEALHVVGDACVTGTVGVCSDRRYKKDVTEIGNALAIIAKLRGVHFNWKRDEYPDHQFSETPQIGFIAQEIAEVVPEVVTRGDDGYYWVDYGRLTPVIVEAIKAQAEEVNKQKSLLDTQTQLLREHKRIVEEKDRQFNELTVRLEKLERALLERKDGGQ